MELPPLTSIEGAYWYLISLIALLALAAGIYIVGVVLGLVPDPVRLVSLTPFVAV